jgi:predicted PurR-regulated permease PerM
VPPEAGLPQAWSCVVADPAAVPARAMAGYCRGLPCAMTDPQLIARPYTLAAAILAGLALALVLVLHLLPALLAGLLVFELVHVIEPPLHSRFPDRRKTLVAVGLLAGAAVLLVGAFTVGLILFLDSDVGNIGALFAKMAEIIVNSRGTLPDWLANQIPADAATLRDLAMQWLHTNAATIQLAGAQTGRGLVYVLLGMIIGALVALHEALPRQPHRNLASALIERAKRLGRSFRSVVFAQVRISALNTIFTAVYLVVILPLFGVHLPLTKTLIGLTFIVGLLPVIGNLISNTMIVIVSLSNSVHAAGGSLLFLVLIHKLEYFLNARIIGKHIEARAWELLAAMLVMEAAFGLAGLVAAPIYYAYLKDELAKSGAI